ncbi:hypothetical protein AAV94_05475 [Lampropedia cohaerens]|uniref:Uncharacterized protein n=1 Tax=Lampropedia cohaerens TaxID=1610491 RepID=A0A0U1Q0R4_9BURK|nr:hypothetical protein AAV94_05475 [Lampropedia cohaerens]
MPFAVVLWLGEEMPAAQRRAAQARFAAALVASLGDAQLVLPTYRAYLRIVAAQGTGSAEGIDAEQLPDDQRHVFENWRIAEHDALTAVFGPHRQMGEALYELQDVHTS